jgi:aspartate aminotransferase
MTPTADSARLSERISRISVSMTMRAAGEAARLKREGHDIVDLGPGEPDFPTPTNIKQAAIRAIEENFTKYLAPAGTPELRQAIAERHAADFGSRYTPAQCVVTAGGKQAVFDLMQVLINRGDEVVIPIPYWVTFRDVVAYAGGTCVFVPPDEPSGFQVTAAMIEPLVTSRTRVILINSPSNPSGAVVDREEFERIYRLAASRGIYLLTDECYCHFAYDGRLFSAASLPGAERTVLAVGSLSKTYSMTGWRVGWVLGPEAVIDAVIKLQSQSISNVTSIAQKAGFEALRGPQESVGVMLAEYRRRRDFVVRRLRQIPGVTCSEPRGAFYIFPRVGASDTLEFASRLLREAQVSVVPGEAFGVPGHLRISYATSMSEIERGLDRLHRFIDSLAR